MIIYDPKPGEVYGSWTVISLSLDGKSRLRKVKCRCSCGAEFLVSCPDLCTGKSKRCRGCGYSSDRRFTGRTFVGVLRNSARVRGINFDLAWGYLERLLESQQGRCAISGVEIVFPKSSYSVKTSERTASVDRINSSCGYIEGNVHWVHKDVNLMKWNLSVARMVSVCISVAKLHEQV